MIEIILIATAMITAVITTLFFVTIIVPTLTKWINQNKVTEWDAGYESGFEDGTRIYKLKEQEKNENKRGMAK